MIFFQQPPKTVPLQNRGHHKDDIFGLAPGVEQQAEQQQHGVFGPAGRRKIGQQYGRQEIIKKRDARKQHAQLLSAVLHNGFLVGDDRGRIAGRQLIAEGIGDLLLAEH